MKKKELLIIFVLAVLVIGLSWFVSIPIDVGWLGMWHFKGLPLSYWSDRHQEINFGYLIIDLLFCFFVLASGWWVVEKLRTKK